MNGKMISDHILRWQDFVGPRLLLLPRELSKLNQHQRETSGISEIETKKDLFGYVFWKFFPRCWVFTLSNCCLGAVIPSREDALRWIEFKRSLSESRESCFPTLFLSVKKQWQCDRISQANYLAPLMGKIVCLHEYTNTHKNAFEKNYLLYT